MFYDVQTTDASICEIQQMARLVMFSVQFYPLLILSCFLPQLLLIPAKSQVRHCIAIRSELFCLCGYFCNIIQ
jgi:hypothetical protein